MNNNTLAFLLAAKALNQEESGPSYILPVASSSVLGGIKIGAGLNIEGDGTLNATALKPINGDSSSPIILSNLDAGVYVISGSYQISTSQEVINLENQQAVFAIQNINYKDSDVCKYIVNLSMQGEESIGIFVYVVSTDNELKQTYSFNPENLANLTTNDKSSLVAAVNELNAKIESLSGQITPAA